MRIAINMGALRGLGSRQVGRGVLDALVALAPPHDVLVWVPRAWGLAAGHLAPRVEVRTVAAGGLSKLAHENLAIRRALGRWGAERLFSMGDTSLPYAGVPHLLLIQQAFVTYPAQALDFPMPLAFRARMAVMRQYLRLGLPSIDRFTVQTHDMAGRLTQSWGVSPAKITVVPSAVELEPDRFGAEPRRAPYVCYVAGWAPHKNHAVLVPMMAALAADFPTLECWLTVPSEAAADLVAAAQARGVLGRFRFAPGLSHGEAMRLLAGAQVAVIPSKLESFGLGYYEAMALGVPVVAADRPFAREACGDTASYAPPDDAVALAGEVRALLADQARRQEVARRGRARFGDRRLSWSEVTRRYLALLETMA